MAVRAVNSRPRLAFPINGDETLNAVPIADSLRSHTIVRLRMEYPGPYGCHAAVNMNVDL